jgi:hypothetical protein
VWASARSLGVWGHAPPSAFGRAAASPQTRQMRCWLSAAQAAYHSFPSLPPTKTRSLRCTAFFPPKPLCWVSAGALLGAVIKVPVLHFFGISVWGWYHYPPAAVAVSEQPRAGFISAEKTAFSEWVLCADGHAVPSCTQRFFGVPAWGWYHYPRRALHAVETLDARGSRWRIRRFYAAPEFALCGLNLPSSGTHATPAPNRAHSGSHAETRRVLRVGGDDVFGSGIIDTIGPFQADQTVAVALAEGHRNAVSP